MLGSDSHDLRNNVLKSDIRILKRIISLAVVSTFSVWQATAVAAESENMQVDEPSATAEADTMDATPTNLETEKRSEKKPVKPAETFIPTEDISEDFAVPYPVDI
jgi:hypothetical protein